MSGRAPPTPTKASPSTSTGWLSLRRIAQQRPQVIAIAWALAVLFILSRLLGDPGIEISGDAQSLVPVEHRAPEGEPLLLLTVDDDAWIDDGPDRLIATAQVIAESLGPHRIPLGPPAAELTAWLDAHFLYLLPVDAHPALGERLSDTAIADAVDGLKARLSSPIYGVSGEEPRRDPLRLAELLQTYAGQLPYLGNTRDMPATLTPAGDLLAMDGRSLLIQLRTDAPHESLLAELQRMVPYPGIRPHLVGPQASRAYNRQEIATRWIQVTMVGFAGLIVVMSLALRAIRPVLAILLVLGSTVLGVVATGLPLGPHDLPMLVLLVGFGCEGAMHLTRISPRGWPAAAVLGGALLPLSLCPYPAWQHWAIRWLVGLAVVVALLRLVVPALLIQWGYTTPPARRGFRLVPRRPLAVLLAVGALATGAWSLPQLPFIGLDRTPRPANHQATEKILRESFFDPRLIVRADSPGDTPADALATAAEHARQWAMVVPADATRVDSPGGLVLPVRQLRARQRSLAAMGLGERMDTLRQQLEARGFRPDAFGEFLRGAADLDDRPTPQAALDGPLGPWIEGYLVDTPTLALVTRVHLQPNPERPIPSLVRSDGTGLVLRGPAVASRRDRQGFADWLGAYVAAQLWISALVVWLGTRSFTTALGCGCASLTAQTAAFALMMPLGVPVGPAMLPSVLLVGAAATVAGGRACQSVRRGERLYATGVLLSGLCQAVAGLALLVSHDPLWQHVGLLVAVGAVLASGAGLFVAPGIMRLLDGPSRTAQPPTAPASSTASSRSDQDDA